MLMDIHVHTTISACSRLSLDVLLDRARFLGLDGVCITDHDTMAARHQIKEGVQENGLLVIVGMEYATTDGDYLLFGPFEDLTPGLSAREVLPLVEVRGGVAIAAHPFRPGRSVNEAIIRDGLCRVVERVNGRTPPEANERTRAWFSRYDLVAVSGSDAHSIEELGAAPVRMLDSITNRAQFIEAIRAGRVEPAQPKIAHLEAV